MGRAITNGVSLAARPRTGVKFGSERHGVFERLGWTSEIFLMEYQRERTVASVAVKAYVQVLHGVLVKK